MNREAEDLTLKTIKQLSVICESVGTRRMTTTNIAKINKIRLSNTLTEKDVDKEMKSKVPVGRECERCPFLEKDWCSFLEVMIFRKSKACTYNL